MKKTVALLASLLSIGLFLGACSSENQEKKEVEHNEVNHNNEMEEVNKNDGEDFVLNLNETSEVEAFFGKFEATVLKIEKIEEVEGEEPSNDTFIKIHVRIKNTSEEKIDLALINGGFYLNTPTNNDSWYDPIPYYDTIKNMEGEIAPNNEAVGELLFNVRLSDYYDVVYDDSVSSKEVRWRFEIME